MTRPTTKTCGVCKIPKPLSEFHRKRDSMDGVRHLCKVCEKQKEDKKKAERAEYGKKYFKF